MLPFFLYAIAFLFFPAAKVLFGAFQSTDGGFTLSNLEEITKEPYRTSFKTSIEVSLVTALVGGALGFLIAYSMIRDGTPKWLRTVFTTFSGVAANFAGIPLAFAFIEPSATSGSSPSTSAAAATTPTSTASRSSRRPALSLSTSTSRSR